MKYKDPRDFISQLEKQWCRMGGALFAIPIKIAHDNDGYRDAPPILLFGSGLSGLG